MTPRDIYGQPMTNNEWQQIESDREDAVRREDDALAAECPASRSPPSSADTICAQCHNRVSATGYDRATTRLAYRCQCGNHWLGVTRKDWLTGPFPDSETNA